MALEIELKLAVHAVDADRVMDQAVVRDQARSPAERWRLISTYFDTPDLELRAQGIGLRLRRRAGRYWQTLKTRGRDSAVLRQRNEWEVELEKCVLDLDLVEDPDLRARLADRALRERLQPVFTTDFHRTACDLAFADGSIVELAVDVGVIRAGGAESPVCEVEVELKSGAPVRVFETALALSGMLSMRVLLDSKARRGYDLVSPPPLPGAKKAGRIKLSPEMSAEEAYRVLLRHGLDSLLRNERVVLKNPADIEGMHQMRVALRRLRICLNIYQALIPRDASRSLTRNLRWLADALGPAREWDVFIAGTLDPILDERDRPPDLVDLRRGVEVLRQSCHARAREAILSSRYTQLVLSLGVWIEGRGWREDEAAHPLDRLDEPVGGFAGTVLENGHRRVVMRGENVRSLDEEARHALRILCKEQRYAVEFFSGLYSGEEIRPYRESLVDLQATLGVLHDAAVTRNLTMQVAPDAPHPGAKWIEDGLEAVKGGRLEDLDQAWHLFLTQFREKSWERS